MSKRRRTQIGAQFSPRRIDMLRSPAYRALSLSAHRVIDRISIEHMDHGGADNGRLPITFADFEAYGIHRHAIAPAIREAAAVGFIEVTQQGRAGNAEWRKPNMFRLTFARSDNDRNDGTHEWMKISEADAPLIAAMARKSEPQKNKSPVPENANFRCRKPHRKSGFQGAETGTTGHGAETAPLSISRGGDRDVA